MRLWTLWTLLLFSSIAWGKTFEPDRTSGSTLVGYLGHADWHWRYDALKVIDQRKLVAAKNDVARLVTDDLEPKVRGKALDVLVHLDGTLAADMAEAMASTDPERRNRLKAVAVMEKQCAERCVSTLAALLEADVDPELRRKAAVVMGKRGWVRGVERLEMAARTDRDPGVRLASLEAILAFPAADRYVIQQALVRDPTVAVRLGVVRAVEKAPKKEDVDALVQALDDVDPNVQRHAARALGRLGDASVAPLLRKKAMDTTNKKVAHDFGEAASTLGG